MKKQEKRQWREALEAIFFGPKNAQIIAKIHLAELFQLYSDNLQSDAAFAEQENTMPLAVLDAGNDLDAPAIQEALLGPLNANEANNPTLAGAIQSAVTESSVVRDLFHFIQRLRENETPLTLDALDIPRYDWNTPTFSGRVWAAINRLFLWETNEGLQKREDQKQIARYAARLPLSTLNQLPKFVATSDSNVSAADRDSVVQALLARCGKRNLLSDAARESLLETARLRTNIRSSVANNHLCRNALYDYLTSDKTTDLGRLHAFLEKDNAENTILALADKDDRFAILYNLHNQKYPGSGDAYSDSNKASETIHCLKDPKLASVLEMDLPLVATQQPEAAIAVMQRAKNLAVSNDGPMLKAWLNSSRVFQAALSRTGLSTAIAMREPTIRVYHALAVHQAEGGKAELTALVQKKPGLFEPTWTEQFDNVSPETFKVYFEALSASSDYASTVAIAQLAIQDGRNTLLNALSGVEWLRWYKKAVTLESGKYLEQVQACLRNQANMPSVIAEQIRSLLLDVSSSDDENGKRLLLESKQLPFGKCPAAFDALLLAMDQTVPSVFNAIKVLKQLKQAEEQLKEVAAASTLTSSDRIAQLERDVAAARTVREETAKALQELQAAREVSDESHKREMANIERQRAALSAEIATRQTTEQQLTQKLFDLSMTLQVTELREQKLLFDRSEHEQSLEQAQMALRTHQAEHQALQATLDERGQALNASESRVATLEQNVTQSSQVLGEQSAELERLKESLQTANSLAEQRQQEAEEKQQSLGAAAAADKENAEQMLQGARDDLNTANEARQQAETALREASQKFNAEKKNSETLSKQLTGARSELERDRGQHQTAQLETEEKRQSAEERLQAELAEKTAAYEEADTRAQNASTTVLSQQAEIHRLREQLRADAEERQLEQASLEAELEEAKRSVEQAEQRIAAVNKNIAGLERKLSESQGVAGEKDSLVQRAEAQITLLQQGLTEAQCNVASKEAELAALQQLVDKAEHSLKVATDTVEVSNLELTQKTKQLGETRQFADAAKRDLASAQEALKAATGDNKALLQAAGQAEVKSQALSLQLAAEQAVLGQLEARVASEHENKTRLQEALSSATGKVETQNTQLLALQSSLGELRERNAQADGQCQLLKQELETALGGKQDAEEHIGVMQQETEAMIEKMAGALNKVRERLKAEKGENEQLRAELEQAKKMLSQAQTQKQQAEERVLSSPLVRPVLDRAWLRETPVNSPSSGAAMVSSLFGDDDEEEDEMSDSALYAALAEVRAENPQASEPGITAVAAVAPVASAVVDDAEEDDDDDMSDSQLYAELADVAPENLGAAPAFFSFVDDSKMTEDAGKENTHPVASTPVSTTHSSPIDLRALLSKLGADDEAALIEQQVREKYPSIEKGSPLKSNVDSGRNAETLAWLTSHSLSPRKSPKRPGVVTTRDLTPMKLFT